MKLTTMQFTALQLLQGETAKFERPVEAAAIRCHDVWYADDVLDRLVKKGLVEKWGRGQSARYDITPAGRAALEGEK